MSIKDANKDISEGTYDICIIGSGPVGLTIASELMDLAKSGKRICVLESGGKSKTPEADLLREVENDGDIVIYFQNSSLNQVTYLGHSDSDTTVASDLVYADGTTANGAPTSLVDISSWEENTRTKDGILIYDPDANNAGDAVKFSLPSDLNDYEAVLRVTSPKEGTVSTGLGVASSASVVVKDTDVLSTYSGLNVVAVGGPCVNQVTAALLGVTFPACGEASGLAEGAATLVLKDNGTKKALVVYGWESDDTRRAAVLAKNPTELKAKLTEAGKLSAHSVTVKGVGLEVSGLSVA